MAKGEGKIGMRNLVAFLKSIIDKSFWTKKIEDRRCKIAISKELDPKLIVKFDPHRPNFGRRANSNIKFPDLIFVSDYPRNQGRLFVIELSKGKTKSRNDIEKQLSSGFKQLHDCMIEKGIENFNSNSVLRAIFYGKISQVTYQEIRKKPLKIWFFGKPGRFVPLHEECSLDDVE